MGPPWLFGSGRKVSLARRLNHPAGQARACVARRLAPEVIRLFMNDHRPAQDGVRPLEAQPIEYPLIPSRALLIRLQIPEIARVMLRIRGGTVRHLQRVEMPARRGEVRRGAIALLMNMKPVLPRR